MNAYSPGTGIRAHVDLLKFSEHVVGCTLLGDAAFVLRELRQPCRAGEECRDQCGTGRWAEVALQPGDVYVLADAARYRWTHEIPGDSIQSRRISLTFRTMNATAWIGT